MNTNMDTFSVTDLRHKTKEVLKNAANHKVVYLLRHAKTEAALVDIAYLQALQEAYEDYLDILEYDATIGLKRIPLTQHKNRLKKQR
ncbi:type II toxin-antitoxin system Phd/YefM family antitoxin [Candidatus Gottesmanbacteria bacterium]|nr:type II toxin-antitoxin system Phd/YefM family antitoxin [Candidatus Gottesmanbacteria bacterium]